MSHQTHFSFRASCFSCSDWNVSPECVLHLANFTKWTCGQIGVYFIKDLTHLFPSQMGHKWFLYIYIFFKTKVNCSFYGGCVTEFHKPWLCFCICLGWLGKNWGRQCIDILYVIINILCEAGAICTYMCILTRTLPNASLHSMFCTSNALGTICVGFTSPVYLFSSCIENGKSIFELSRYSAR